MCDVVSSGTYITIHIGNKNIGKTSVSKNSTSPEWHQHFDIPILHFKSSLTFTIFHKRDILQDEAVGNIVFSLDDLRAKDISEEVQNFMWLPIENSKIVAKGSLDIVVNVKVCIVVFSLLQIKSM